MEPELQAPTAPTLSTRPKPVVFLIILLIALALVAVAVVVNPELRKTSSSGSVSVTTRGAGAFGVLTLGGQPSSMEDQKGAGEATAEATAAPDSSPVVDPGSSATSEIAPYYGPIGYAYTGPALTVAGGMGDVFAFDTTNVPNEMDAFSRMLGISRRDAIRGDYDLESFGLVSKDGKRRLSFSPSTWMVYYSDYDSAIAGSIYATTSPGGSGQAPALDDSTALNAAATFVDENNISVADYGAPIVLDQPGSYPSGTATVVYPLSLNGLPVYDQSSQPFGIQLYIGMGGTVQSASYPRNLSLIKSSYPLVDDSKSITSYLDTYYGGVRMLGMPVKEGTTTVEGTVIPLKTATNAYMVQNSYSTVGVSTSYFVPALSFDIAKEDQEKAYMSRIVVPTIKSFYDNISTQQLTPSATGMPADDVMPMMK